MRLYKWREEEPPLLLQSSGGSFVAGGGESIKGKRSIDSSGNRCPTAFDGL
ncbi:hypothetical protein [Paenibacillus sp. FJAT-26967]|uniref:hypothetical protein n=1 Tax=Paenibacillus sp. FJAT-26967 TaxID=1729690 RepID=UPI0012E3E078|nr:hypothetical protein [Paenibacillus sp. FJAT-26967]